MTGYDVAAYRRLSAAVDALLGLVGGREVDAAISAIAVGDDMAWRGGSSGGT
jgi:hypothetical protein